MQRPWPTSVKIVLSVALVFILFCPFADYKWTLFPIQAFDPFTGSDPVYVSGPVGDVTEVIANYTWRISLALAEAVFASIAAIGIFVGLDRFVGSGLERETLCRRCGQILRGLRVPKCPACGEPL